MSLRQACGLTAALRALLPTRKVLPILYAVGGCNADTRAPTALPVLPPDSLIGIDEVAPDRAAGGGAVV